MFNWQNVNPKNHPSLGGLILLTLTFFAAYIIGISQILIPSNGDEWVYAHITRITALQVENKNQLLPLQSAMADMRNTKPPLLFAQGIWSTDTGKDWRVESLRYPSVIYTLAIFGLIFYLSLIFFKNINPSQTFTNINPIKNALLAGIIYLGFFSTFRYGRPFLTNSPETFWFMLSCVLFLKFLELHKNYLLMFTGLSLGIVFLYKSPALLLPIILTFSGWLILAIYPQIKFINRRKKVRLILSQVASIVLISCIALFVFSLWFVFDPSPQTIWREFILGENLGKFDPHGPSYLQKLFVGSSSIWALLLAFNVNGGLLILLMLCLWIVAGKGFYKKCKTQNINTHSNITKPIFIFSEKYLWLAIGVFLIIFSLPSQRSGRYLLDIMPFVAILISLYWQKIPRLIFQITLILILLFYLILLFTTGSVAIVINNLGGILGQSSYPLWHWLIGASGIIIILAGLFFRCLCKTAVLWAVAIFYVLLTSSLHPIESKWAKFDEKIITSLKGLEVAVACTFRASDEGYRFILSSADVRGFTYNQTPKPWQNFAYTLLQSPLTSPDPVVNKNIMLSPITTDCPKCYPIASRLLIRNQHPQSEIKAMFTGNVSQNIFNGLFVRETLWRNPDLPEISQKPYHPCS